MKIEININNDLEAIEKASIDELRALQLGRMKWSVRHAYDNVAMYHRKYDEAGVHPDDLQKLEDLAKFPYTTKQDLRDNYPFGTFAVPMEAGGADTRIERHHRQTDRGRLHTAGYRRLGRG